jgi:hypothetical protein
MQHESQAKQQPRARPPHAADWLAGMATLAGCMAGRPDGPLQAHPI